MTDTPDPEVLSYTLPKSRPKGKPTGRIGRYTTYQEIGRGGMGEVLVAFDPTCGRQVALKRIRTDLKTQDKLLRRFLWEARLTSQLIHPAIIPIYTIHVDGDAVYYTMPWIEGPTLKRIIINASKAQRAGERIDQQSLSIPALTRTFLSVCQAVAYAHDHGVLHRDLKLENVIIGQYGEVYLLDWGLAKRLSEIIPKAPQNSTDYDAEDDEIGEEPSSADITRVGKVVGTISHMAPERGRGGPASFQTEVYALGVMLYQLLTLKLPFRRPKTMEEFRDLLDKGEELPAPDSVAPYREVPRMLSRIVQRCLAADPKERYLDVNALIEDLQNYLEGRSEWFPMAKLDMQQKDDWQFQEHVLLPEYSAITRESASTNWMSLMVSEASFTGNVKLTARVRFGDKSHGLGFLLNVPEHSRRSRLNEGYSLWIGTDQDPAARLYRSGIEVLSEPELACERGRWYRISIEHVDSQIRFFLDGHLEFSYISRLPLSGTHVGLLARDGEFELEDFTIHVGSMQAQVSCLAVPDAFLAAKDYGRALEEYKRIGNSFPGRAEGREALFRAGLTLLERAKAEEDSRQFDLALEQFEELHATPGAPLEYLGKALVYQSQSDLANELNSLELGCRRYPKHPLAHLLREQILFRAYEASHTARPAAYRLLLIVAQLLPDAYRRYGARKLFQSVRDAWEPIPYFIERDIPPHIRRLDTALHLAFWLNRPLSIQEILRQLLDLEKPDASTLCNGLIAMRLLGYEDAITPLLDLVQEKLPEAESIWQPLAANGPLSATELSRDQWRLLHVQVDEHLLAERAEDALRLLDTHADSPCESDTQLQLTAQRVWALLQLARYQEAGELLHTQPRVLLSQQNLPLHPLYGCWLAATEGERMAALHFNGVLEAAYPRSWALLAHWKAGHISPNSGWRQQSFPWERRQLYRMLALYEQCCDRLDSATALMKQARDAIG